MPYKPSEDQIQDDKNRLISIKQDFLYAMEQVARGLSSKGIIDSLISAEEHFNDALHDEWYALCAADGVYDDLPQSVHMKKWLHEQKPSAQSVQCGMACQQVQP